MPIMVLLTLLIGYICFGGVQRWRSQTLETAGNAILLGYLLGFLGCVGFALFDITFFDARVNVVNWLLITGLYRLGQGVGLPAQSAYRLAGTKS